MIPENTLTKFRVAIVSQKKKKKDIAQKMGITAGHLSNLLNGRDNFDEGKREKLNSILKTNF